MAKQPLTDDQKWEASLTCDAAFDGVFYYGVKTTGIFCKPSCKSKSPKRENVQFFDTAEEAIASGLRPCKRCRPDLLAFQPILETAAAIKAVCDAYYTDGIRLKDKLSDLGLSRNRVAQIFQSQYDTTPNAYISQLRIDHAKELLLKDEKNVLQIALESGFDSLSSFYEQFKKVTELTPNAYRHQLRQKEK